ncbi:hypothetical protein [Streptomyces coeruleorubidus]|uniref:Uncharacterized protein n=1 Tax=Streptomyces coeruleorubidus TaxID=116188 RepID=A0A5J6HUD4_STRC4|nr:hypothetical protein [Streptomyces coeruleorubidus]QEV23969.1 hypothetical protein CP976_07295 [Streptomyces coeruleorubidus]GGT85736.1 hypothetical protein GCM10010256_52320 [Streptomyces coeruleorubidus]
MTAPTPNLPLVQATHDAVEAADNSQQLQIINAILQAQAIAQAIQPQQPHTCQHQHKQPANVGKWIGISCAVCVGSIGLALGFLAVAIAAVCGTTCLLVLRSMWRQYMGEKR